MDAPATPGSYSYRAVASYHTWTATSSIAGPVTVTIDVTAPTVQSIGLLDATRTKSSSARWTVTFSEAVTGVGTGDFTLTQTGVSGATVSTAPGSGTTYTVTSSTGSGDGTLRLNLVDDDSIVDAAANKLGGAGTGNGNLAGETYTVDKTAPAVGSIVRVAATPTNASTAQWTVTFSESATGVGTADFTLTQTAVSGATVSTATGGGTTYTVTSSTGSGDGTLRLNLVDDDSIVDAAANALGGAGTGNGDLAGQTYAVDKTAPTLIALQMLDVDANGKVDRVTATFSETLASSTLTAAWTLASVPSSGSLASVSTGGAVATLALTEGAGAADTAAGSLTVALAANAAGIRDAAGNQASFGAVAPTDKAGPAPLSISDSEGQIPLFQVDGQLQGGDALVATFSEAIASGLPGSLSITESRGASGNAFLTITAFTNGALDMGSANYVTLALVSVTFTGTSALTNANKTITVTAGSCALLCIDLFAGTGTTMVYVPATTLLDAAGNAAAGSHATGFRIF